MISTSAWAAADDSAVFPVLGKAAAPVIALKDGSHSQCSRDLPTALTVSASALSSSSTTRTLRPTVPYLPMGYMALSHTAWYPTADRAARLFSGKGATAGHERRVPASVGPRGVSRVRTKELDHIGMSWQANRRADDDCVVQKKLEEDYVQRQNSGTGAVHM